MTENELIRILEDKARNSQNILNNFLDRTGGELKQANRDIDMRNTVKSILEEIQEYRALDDKLQMEIGITMKELYEKWNVMLAEYLEYQQLGTVEEVKCAMKYLRFAKKHGTIGQVIDACAEYEELGTVEELREAREKHMAKKIIIVKARNEIEDVSIGDFVHYKCANCGKRIGSAFHYPPNEYMMEYKFCDKCGQKLDWSEEE